MRKLKSYVMKKAPLNKTGKSIESPRLRQYVILPEDKTKTTATTLAVTPPGGWCRELHLWCLLSDHDLCRRVSSTNACKDLEFGVWTRHRFSLVPTADAAARAANTPTASEKLPVTVVQIVPVLYDVACGVYWLPVVMARTR